MSEYAEEYKKRPMGSKSSNSKNVEIERIRTRISTYRRYDFLFLLLWLRHTRLFFVLVVQSHFPCNDG